MCALEIDCDALLVNSESAVSAAIRHEFWGDVDTDNNGNPFERLLRLFDDAEVVVGYNCLDFDFPLLRKHYSIGRDADRRFLLHKLKTLDPFSRIRAASNVWPSLGKLLKANGLPSKSGDGCEAVKLWETGKRAELASYCHDDVLLTARVVTLPRLVAVDTRGGPLDGLTLHNNVFGLESAIVAVRHARRVATTEPTETTVAADNEGSEREGAESAPTQVATEDDTQEKDDDLSDSNTSKRVRTE